MIYGFNAGEVFKIALNIEENGRIFYTAAAARTDNEAVKKIFQELGEEEIKHKERFTELMKDLPGAATGSTVWDPDNEIDQYLKMMADMHVFNQASDVEAMVEKLEGPEAALKLAMQFEKDSIIFFAEMQGLAESQEGRDNIGKLVKEEQSHLKRLAIQLRDLTGCELK